jgi:hypothetical protein
LFGSDLAVGRILNLGSDQFFHQPFVVLDAPLNVDHIFGRSEEGAFIDHGVFIKVGRQLVSVFMLGIIGKAFQLLSGGIQLHLELREFFSGLHPSIEIQ